MTEQWIAVKGKPLRYVEAGSGPPIIFAAGLGISADFYRPNIATLAHAGFRAMAPDFPGFGRTQGPWLGASVDRLEDHLAGFTAAMHITHAGWIGHSLGCQPLLRLAAAHPELVKALVLAGPTGGYGHRLLHQVRALAAAAVQEPWRLMRAVLRDYVRLSPFSYLGTWIRAAADDPLVSAQSVRQPALILVGTRDQVPGPEFLANLSKELRADVLKLPAGNHGLPLDAQTEFDEAVTRFFRTHL